MTGLTEYVEGGLSDKQVARSSGRYLPKAGNIDYTFEDLHGKVSKINSFRPMTARGKIDVKQRESHISQKMLSLPKYVHISYFTNNGSGIGIRVSYPNEPLVQWIPDSVIIPKKVKFQLEDLTDEHPDLMKRNLKQEREDIQEYRRRLPKVTAQQPRFGNMSATARISQIIKANKKEE